MTSPKKYRHVTRRSSNFLFLTFDFRPAMLRKNLARCCLLLRHVFTYTPALFSHKRKTCTNNLDFILPPDPDGRLSVIYFFESFEVFIQLETTRNCLKPGLKQGDMGTSYCFYQNKFMLFSRYSCFLKQYWSNHIPYSRENTSVYLWSPFFFSRIYFPVTQICQSVDLVNFSSLLLLSWLLVYSFTDRNRTQKVTGQNSRSLVVETLFLFTLRVSLTRLRFVNFQQTIVSLFYCS